MDIDVDMSQIAKMGARYAGAAPIVKEEMTTAMNRSVLMVEGSAKRIVPVKTGNLRRSLTHEVRATGGGVIGVVGTNVKYARIVEEGRGPVVARAGGMLRFEIGGQVIFRNRVGPAKGKPYLKPGLRANQARIEREFDGAIIRVVRRIGVSG